MNINLTELFEVQRKLDAEIERKHPTASGEDRLAKRILALQVELGELANEWRGFKFWSTDQETRYKKTNIAFPNPGEPYSYESYPLLEEYVDCLHFILSIGLEEDVYSYHYSLNFEPVKEKSVVNQFSTVFHYLHELEFDGDSKYYFMKLVQWFVGLGEMLGFTWEQIEEAYMSKNKTNWERQANGY